MREIDVLVVGAGPGGMSAAQYAARAGYSTLVLDPMWPGGQLLFIDEIENYPGLGKISGYFLSESMENQCKEFGVEIEYDEVKKIEKKDSSNKCIQTHIGIIMVQLSRQKSEIFIMN